MPYGQAARPEAEAERWYVSNLHVTTGSALWKLPGNKRSPTKSRGIQLNVHATVLGLTRVMGTGQGVLSGGFHGLWTLL